MFVVFLSDALLTLGASFVLFGKLRKTQDLIDMSLEIQRVGAFALGSLGEWRGVDLCISLVSSILN